MQLLQIMAPVPAWAKVLCPHATLLRITDSTCIEPQLHQARPHPHLRHLDCEALARFRMSSAGLVTHMRRQLATLPRLTSLTIEAWADQRSYVGVRRLFSTNVTRLEFVSECRSEVLRGLPTWFPCLRGFCAPGCTVDGDGLAALLRLPHLERVHVGGFSLWPWLPHHHGVDMPHGRTWRELAVEVLDVDAFARLPLDSIQACRLDPDPDGVLQPRTDAASVARVAQAIQRWGGLSRDGRRGFTFSGADVEALLVTLGPLVAALPAAQQHFLTIRDLQHATPQQVQQLGLHLPASVTTLCLDWSYPNRPPSHDVLAALLPSLPATVEELQVHYLKLKVRQVLAVCLAAVRPIRVAVLFRLNGRGLTHYCLGDIRDALRGSGQEAPLVTLVLTYTHD